MTFEEWWDTCGDATWWNKGQPTSWLASKAAWEAASHEPHLIPAAWTRIIESVLARVVAGEPAAQVVADYADEHGHTIEGLEKVERLLKAADARRAHTEGVMRLKEAADKRAGALEDALRKFVDADRCVYDHHGYCQTHGPGEIPCEVAQARALLEDPADG